MTPDTPAPVPVAELIAQRREGFSCAPDGYLAADEIARAWPVVWRLDAFIQANEVRTASGTFGHSYQDKYHAGDVQRVADAIADGTALLAPHWRRDTAEGRVALREHVDQEIRQEVRSELVLSAVVLVLLLGLGVLLWLADTA
ncbi:hypothetical protein AB0I84_10890 [Streptomyces spectabilis]|uniref:hypothetical protein n=1 Tax=Streptomyces spectabilis TaxID=68270 RepID=UPI0033CDE6E7